MQTIQLRGSDLDGEEAIALSGMFQHYDLIVPPQVFRHTGRRAVVIAWQLHGGPSIAAEVVATAETHADKAEVREALEDIAANEPMARNPARWKESCATVLQVHDIRAAEEKLERTRKGYERGEVSEAGMAAAYQALGAAKGRAAVATPPGGQMERLLERLKDWHGREHIGLRIPSLPGVTKRMDGLRGLMFMGGRPGTGKTSLALQMAFDAVEHDRDTVGVFVTCEMSDQEIVTNLATRLADITAGGLLKGRNNLPPDEETGLRLQKDELERLHRAVNRVRALNLRWAVVSPRDLGGSFDGKDGRNPFHAVVGLVERMKAEAGASRSVVVFDNLQALPVAEPTGGQWRGEQALERDRYTIAKLNELTDTEVVDAVIVISEQNKDGMGKDDDTSLLGTGRSLYAADATVVLRDPEAYAKLGEGDKLRDSHYKSGFRWVVWSLKKGRAGMDRGAEELTYDFRYHRFVQGFAIDREAILQRLREEAR